MTDTLTISILDGKVGVSIRSAGTIRGSIHAFDGKTIRFSADDLARIGLAVVDARDVGEPLPYWLDQPAQDAAG